MKKYLALIAIAVFLPSFAFATIVSFKGNVSLKGAVHFASLPVDLPVGAYLFQGDSLTFGAPSGTNPPSLRVKNLLDAAGNSYSELTNFGISGATLQQMITGAPTTEDTHIGLYPGKKDIVIIWGGTNDIAGGQTLLVVESRLTNYVQGRKALGAKVVVLTTIARDFNDGGADEAVRQAYNAWIRANWNGSIGADKLVDVAADSRFTNFSNATYYQSDRTHLTAAGYSGIGDDIYAKLIPWQ